LLAGKIDFYMGGNMLQAFSAVEQNIPLRVVAASFQKEPQVLMTHPGQGLDTWESLKDAEQYILGDEGFQSYFQWMITDFGFEAAKRVPYTFNPAPFIANPRSAQQGYITSEPFSVAREGGFEPDIWVIADHGYSAYSTTIVGMRDYVEANPEVAKCFVEGTAKGWANFLYGDNAAALAKIKEDNPDKSDEQLAYSIEKLKEYGIVDSGDTLTLGIGAMTEERMNAFYEQMVGVGVMQPGLDVASTYTLEYSNSGASLEVKAALGVQ
jgi:NitT/TauT family transport system substrate-binding protein